ncbi:NUDIX hydrolase [Zhongshania sp.]|jgi:8-oxo-dGTP pyrophosphatase MutT (NUDIX family)|uniref:NUDIX hydrolase n=1 Tax=Zhongshania sp. TaxID=1971902 RepID=UPI001B45FB65|nr:NUDIX hydrolase [Zhongshania sp.]MBQ0796084.1 NUDIX hydrolase [Zhongshania sp.]
MTTDIRAAATVVIVRDGDKSLEILLLRRHTQLKVGGGHWVFPGGTVDPEDAIGAETDEQAARAAAIRETQEEAGLKLSADNLLFLSHWTTPPSIGRRFATWFYLAEGDRREIVVDGEEMDDYRWGAPEEFLQQHRCGELALMPPTVVTLTELAACVSQVDAQRFYSDRDVPYFEPRISSHNDCVCMLYGGDAGYSNCDPNVGGPRNRCYLENGVWRYEYSTT